MTIHDLRTPALLVDGERLEANLRTMAAALPGGRLRPHVKAHKCTALARRQRAHGALGFTCATVAEAEGMAAAGLGDDLLLANEVLDTRRLAAIPGHVTVAVDSVATIEAAARGGIRDVLVDVNVGLPRCGCRPENAGALADLARARGLRVRGVMGYEGHAMLLPDREARATATVQAMALLDIAHQAVGGEIVSAGGTGTFDLNTRATEIQAGSYVLMDTAYAALGLPFVEALSVLATVISVSSAGYAVADCGAKALGMDHGNPAIDAATVWFCSDEHITFAPTWRVRPGDRIRIRPAHVDPTVACHCWLYITDGEEVLERWAVDLRGW